MIWHLTSPYRSQNGELLWIGNCQEWTRYGLKADMIVYFQCLFLFLFYEINTSEHFTTFFILFFTKLKMSMRWAINYIWLFPSSSQTLSSSVFSLPSVAPSIPPSLSASEEYCCGSECAGACGHCELHSAVWEPGAEPSGGHLCFPSAGRGCCLQVQHKDRTDWGGGWGSGETEGEERWQVNNETNATIDIFMTFSFWDLQKYNLLQDLG